MLYIIAYDNFCDYEYFTGMMIVNDEALISHTLLMLHRGSTSTMFKTVKELPEGINSPYGVATV